MKYLDLSKPPFIIQLFFLADIALCAIYALHSLVFNYLVAEPYWKLATLVDLSGESSIGTWYSSMKLFCISFFAFVWALGKHDRQKRSFLLFLLPTLFLLMSMDEIVQIHEWIGLKSDALLPNTTRKGTALAYTGIWMFILGIPFIILLCAFFLTLRSYFSNSFAHLRKLVLGISVLLVGALGFELLSNFTSLHLLVVVELFEEGFEMIGATIILWAVYDMASGFISSMLTIHFTYQGSGGD